MKCLNKTVEIKGSKKNVRVVRFSKQTHAVLGDTKIKRDNLCLLSRKNKDIFTMSIRNDIDDNNNSYNLAQINLTKEDLINLRDEINKSLEGEW